MLQFRTLAMINQVINQTRSRQETRPRVSGQLGGMQCLLFGCLLACGPLVSLQFSRSRSPPGTARIQELILVP